MSPAEIEAAKAAFLARGGAITTADAGIAYGVDRETDRMKRLDARIARVEADQAAFDADYERMSERSQERVREAAHTRGSAAAIAAMGCR